MMNRELQPLDAGLSRENRLAQAQERFTEYIETAEADPGNHILRPKQIELMRELHDSFQEDGWDLSGYSSLPTGVGKTFLFASFLQATGLRGLVVAPTMSITDANKETVQYLNGNDRFVGSLYGGGSQKEAQHITFTTYNSFVRRSAKLHSDNFDVLILDEAHCALGPSTRAAIEEYSRCIKIGFTATDEYSYQSVKEILPREISRMSLKEAVESGLLAPLHNIVAMTDLDMSNVKSVGKTLDYRTDDLEKIVNVSDYNRWVVELYVANFLGQKALASCASVRHAYNLADTFRKYGILSEPIEGRMSRKKQLEIEERCKITDPNSLDRIDVLTNAKLAEVGFDNPLFYVNLNTVPTLSQVKQAQRARVTRLNPDDPDKVGKVVDFVGRNLRCWPVLYAHSRIAGAAALGLDYDQLPDYNSIDGIKVISDPYEVDSLVAKYAEDNAALYRRPPDDWIVLSGISGHIKIASGPLISGIINGIRESNPDFYTENSAEFTVSGMPTDSRIGTYFSPRFIREIESAISFPEAAPEGWLARPQIAALYDIDERKISNYLLQITKETGDEGYVAKYATGPETTKMRNYYSPRCLKAMAESLQLPYYGDSVPDNWRSVEQLSAEFGPNATKEALKSLSRLQKNILGIRIADHRIASDGMEFYSGKVSELIKARVAPSAEWLSWDDLIEQDGINPSIIEKLGNELKEWNITGKLCMVDGQEVRYYEARLRTLIRKIADDL